MGRVRVDGPARGRARGGASHRVEPRARSGIRAAAGGRGPGHRPRREGDHGDPRGASGHRTGVRGAARHPRDRVAILREALAKALRDPGWAEVTRPRSSSSSSRTRRSPRASHPAEQRPEVLKEMEKYIKFGSRTRRSASARRSAQSTVLAIAVRRWASRTVRRGAAPRDRMPVRWRPRGRRSARGSAMTRGNGKRAGRRDGPAARSGCACFQASRTFRFSWARPRASPPGKRSSSISSPNKELADGDGRPRRGEFEIAHAAGRQRDRDDRVGRRRRCRRHGGRQRPQRAVRPARTSARWPISEGRR